MAQTTQYTSFVPVFFVIASPYPLCTLIVLILPIKMTYMISIYKKHEYKLKKHVLMGPFSSL